MQTPALIFKVTKIVSKKTDLALESTDKNNPSSLESYVIRIEEEIFDAEKVAEILSSSKKVVERELREGKMTGYKRLNKWFVLKSDLISYIRDGEEE